MVTSLRKSSSTIELPLTKIQQTRSSLDTPYTPILENLKNQISELVNPFLADDINTVFEQIGSTPSLDPKEGIKHLFNTLPLPKEIDGSLKQLDTHVQGFMSPGVSTDEILNQITHFQLQVSDLYKQNDQVIKEKQSKFIKEKKILYQIPEIKKIHSVAMRAIDTPLSTKIDLPRVRKQIEKLIKKEVPNIDGLISKSTKGIYPDLYRIVIPILCNNEPSKKAPHKETGQSNLEKKIIELTEKINQNREQYFEVFFENLVNNNLKTIDKELIEKSDLMKDLESLQLSYARDTDSSTSIGDILIKIIKRINFSEVFDNNKECMELLDAAKLIQQATQAVEKVKGRDVTLLFGNTGAGKSTFAGYLLGAKIKLSNNKADYKKGQDITSLPEIVHKQIISGTSFPSGYIREDYTKWGIVDCPGFLDTRGSKHQIATYLTIESLRSVNTSIKSVVVVVKASDFDSRPPKFLDIVKNTRTFFKFAFKKNIDNSNIFLIVTHNESEHLEDLCEKISTGSLYQTYINELNEQITKQPDKASDYLDQIEIWESLKDMAKNKQVDFVDIEKSDEAKNLIEKYQRLKEKPVPIKRSESNQDSFKTTLTTSITAWTKLIYEQFYIQIPALNEFNNKLIDKWQKRKKEFISINEKLNKKIKKQNKLLEKFKNPKGLFQELKQEKSNEISNLKFRIVELKSENSEFRKNKQKLQQEELNYEEKKKELDDKIQSLENSKEKIDEYKCEFIQTKLSENKTSLGKIFTIGKYHAPLALLAMSWFVPPLSVAARLLQLGTITMGAQMEAGTFILSSLQSIRVKSSHTEKLSLQQKLANIEQQLKGINDNIEFIDTQTEKMNKRINRAEGYLLKIQELKNNTVKQKETFLQDCYIRDIKQYHDQIEENNKDMSEIELKIKNLQEINEQKQKKLKQIAFFVCQNKELLDCIKNFSQTAIDLKYKHKKTYEDFNHLCNKQHPSLVNDAKKILKIV